MQLRKFTKLTGLLMSMLIYANGQKKLSCVFFPKRWKIDKTQLTLGRPGVGLKTCKIPSSSVNSKMLHFSVYHFPQSVHACSFSAKTSAILINFSDFRTLTLSMYKISEPIRLIIVSQCQKYLFLHINEATYATVHLRKQFFP